MLWRRKPLRASTLLIILIKVFSGQTLTCSPAEYEIGDECCPKCPAGHYVEIDCFKNRSTFCLPCTDGTFMDKPTGRTMCYTCTPLYCDAGLGLRTSCTATSDTVCEPLEGFYCVNSTENDCVAAQKHSSCQPGQYINQPGTASTDTVCSDCSAGTFSDGTFTSCRPHIQCDSINLQLIKPGTASTDAECGEESYIGAVVVTIGVFSVGVLFICVGLVYFLLVKKSIFVPEKQVKTFPERDKWRCLRIGTATIPNTICRLKTHLQDNRKNSVSCRVNVLQTPVLLHLDADSHHLCGLPK